MSAVVARKRGVVGLAVIAAVMVGVLASLGAWQLQRRSEKHALIDALTERLATAPVALPPASQWSELNPARDEFKRVTLTATYERKPDAMVYSSGSAVRTDISGPGTWAFLPAMLPGGGRVVVNAGFVQNTMQERPQQDRAVASLVTGAPVNLSGYLRFPEAAGTLTPAENADKRLWFTRDHVAIARVLGWGQDNQILAPFYIDLEAPVPANGTPKPGPLDVRLKDNHLQYAVTWFGLAIVVLIAFAAWVVQDRRRVS